MKTTRKLLALWFAACLSVAMPAFASQKSSPEKDKSWIPETLERQSFGIEINRMFTPGGIVNLAQPGFFLLKSGRMQAHLPYIGRFHASNLAIAYKRTIDIEAPVIDYKVYSTQRGFRVRYKIFQVGENFDVELRVNRNGYATVYIYSSLRSDIRYSGELKMLRF